MAQYVYGVEIPLADGYSWYELVRADTPEHAAEVVRVLLSTGIRGPVKIQVVTHPVVGPDESVVGQ